MDNKQRFYFNLMVSILVLSTGIYCISLFVDSQLDGTSANYFYFGACPLISTLVGLLMLYNSLQNKQSSSSVAYLTCMLLNFFYLSRVFMDSQLPVFFLLLSTLTGILMLINLVKYLKR